MKRYHLRIGNHRWTTASIFSVVRNLLDHAEPWDPKYGGQPTTEKSELIVRYGRKTVATAIRESGIVLCWDATIQSEVARQKLTKKG